MPSGDSFIYFSREPRIPKALRPLESRLKHIYSLEDMRDISQPLIVDESKFSEIKPLLQMNSSPPFFINVDQLDLKKLAKITPILSLSGIIHNEMSHEELLELMERKAQKSPVLSTDKINKSSSLSFTGDKKGGVLKEKMVVFGHLLEDSSHILYKPLLNIQSLAQKWIELCDKGYAPSPHFPSDIKHVKQSAERCTQIIKSLMEFSEGRVEPSVLSLNHLVQSTLVLIKPIANQFNCQLELQSSNDKIWGRVELVRQVILNIIHNAFQASKHGDTLKIKVYNHKDDLVCFEVQDFGMGMAEEHLSQIFTPFFTTKAKGEGTGLGLNLSQKIIHSQKGSIHIQSKLGQGTRVQILWPLYKE